jgi:putative membrane protein
MDQNFSKPQKQSATGVIIMFVNGLQKVIRAIALPIIFIIIKSKGAYQIELILGIALLVSVLLALYAWLSYHNFSFFLDEDKQEFVINEGVFNKSTLTIQLNKIQQVNINQSLLQQIIGVYSLDIDTAGSEKKEASIKAIDHLTATRLKQRLLSERDHAATASITGENDTCEITLASVKPMLKLSNATLLKVGLTSNYGASILLLMGFIFGLIQFFKDYTAAFEVETNEIYAAVSHGFGLISICLFIGFALIVVLGTNIIRTFFRYFQFKIIRQKGALAISSGLLTRKNTLVTPRKVQLSAYSQNYFQKKLGILNMKVKQAAYGTADEEESKKSHIEIPGCNELERDDILKMIYPLIPAKGKALVPNYRFLFLQIMLKIAIPSTLVCGFAFAIYQPLQSYLALLIPYAVLVSIMLYFEYKHHRLYAVEGFIIKKSGIWDIEEEIIETHKIQAITSKQYFWHKNADVGHLLLHTAAGIIHFKYGNYTQINNLVNYWLYQVERTKKDWS